MNTSTIPFRPTAAIATKLNGLLQTSDGRRLPTEPALMVDQLGCVKAQIATLEKEEKRLRDAIAELDCDAIDGELFRATVSHSEVAAVDWKTIAEKCEPSRQLVAAHTELKDRVTVKVVAR
jgi:hypothetical protein